MKTFRNPIGTECCAECAKPVGDLAADQRLYQAAKRLQRLWKQQRLGLHYGANEDLQAQRELIGALQAVEETALAQQLVNGR